MKSSRHCFVIATVWSICCENVAPFTGPSPSSLMSFKSSLSSNEVSWINSFAQRPRRRHPFALETMLNDEDNNEEENDVVSNAAKYHSLISSERRRSLLSYSGQMLFSSLVLLSTASNPTYAANLPQLSQFISNRRRTTYIVDPKSNSTMAESLRNELLESEPMPLNAELCLLQLLPIKQPVFRQLQAFVSSLSSLQHRESDEELWKKAQRTMQETLQYLDSQRSLLQPVFNQDENTLLQITKGERYEQLVETLRYEILDLMAASKEKNATRVFREQKEALMALANMGELMVSTFPFDVPQVGKFSFLPRLLGRARVTFTFKRKNTVLGNVTIVADGFAAPITAGNFVDLCIRNFYTGLPVKIENKRFDGKNGEGVVAALPILGSYNEGFIDPLTARPRRIPLEIVRLEKSTGLSKLSYADGFTDLSSEATLEPQRNNKPVLSFSVPGLVALNHPAKNVNGGSSEFFCLREDTLPENEKSLLDGEYAPFGYVVEGLDLFRSLQVGDIIDSTSVGEWGMLNLVKIRLTSFSDMQGSEEEEA